MVPFSIVTLNFPSATSWSKESVVGSSFGTAIMEVKTPKKALTRTTIDKSQGANMMRSGCRATYGKYLP